jgi:hypothetical protein
MGLHRSDELHSLRPNLPTKVKVLGECKHSRYAIKVIISSSTSDGQVDVYPLRDQIESELLSLEEKRQRRDTEKALIKNREDVEALYNRLRAKETYKYLPSLPTFRQLPVVKLLQAGVYLHGTTISDTLQENPLMRQQLDQDVERWTETAKQDLAVVLGFPRQWKSANKKVLHPVERVTARFLCTKCGVDGTDRRMDGCLNFAAACLHVCQGKNGKNDRYRRSKKAAWNPGNFVKDEKVGALPITYQTLIPIESQAINVLKSAMSILKMSEEIDKSFDLAPYGHAVLCTSCEPSMLLHTRNMVCGRLSRSCVCKLTTRCRLDTAIDMTACRYLSFLVLRACHISMGSHFLVKLSPNSFDKAGKQFKRRLT